MLKQVKHDGVDNPNAKGGLAGPPSLFSFSEKTQIAPGT